MIKRLIIICSFSITLLGIWYYIWQYQSDDTQFAYLAILFVAMTINQVRHLIREEKLEAQIEQLQAEINSNQNG